MRRMTEIQIAEKSIRMTSTFRGYNHHEIIADGEMFNTQNLADDLYPILTVRKKRGIRSWDTAGQDPVPLNGICGRDKLVHIRGTKVYYDFSETDLTVSAAASMLPKKIVGLGAYVCIWPDKVYINTLNLNDYGSMEVFNTKGGSSVSLQMCRGDGTNYDMTDISVGSTAPEDPENGKLWIDQSTDLDVLRQYSSASSEWVEVASTYVKISAEGIGTGLKEYDAVTIKDMEAVDTETQRVKDQVKALNGNFIVYGCGTNYVIIAGLISKTHSALKSQDIHINRTVPDLEFICESNNRLWGCVYGWDSSAGAFINEIRASKLGDFKNWSCFMGLSTDSYTARIGTDGDFTGCAVQRGYPVFFKEDCIHRVAGSMPSNFQITTTKCKGVQKWSGDSVAVINETIYYKSRKDVMAYDGNTPISISEQLGDVQYNVASAGVCGDKYYISMKDTSNKWNLFVYNTKNGIWYREDNLHAMGFGTVGDELYIIDEDNNTMLCVSGNNFGRSGTFTLEEDPEWSAEFGLSGIDYQPNAYGNMARSDINGSHYLSRFDIRMYMEPDSRAELEIMYDSDGVWTKQGEIRGTRMKTFVLPVIPKRCDHLRFRIRGKGAFRLYSIARYLEVGSDA